MTRYWKQFAGWGTALRHRYHNDIFFATRLKIITLHIASVLLSISVFTILLRFTHQKIFSAIVETLELVLSSGTLDENIFPQTIDSLEKVYAVIFGVLILSIGAFGYIIAGVTLRPARQIMETQKRFIADVSHELRTPLSIMKTSTEVALLEDYSSRAVEEMVKSNMEEIDRISEIINNLLSFSNVGKSGVLSFGEVNLIEVVETALRRFEELAKKKRISIHFTPTDRSIIRGNKTALEQVALNLIKNAIIYTPTGGTISVQLSKDHSGNIQLTVSDSGIGIAEKDLRHIFEPFYRTDSSRQRSRGGSGLGLAIVYEIIKVHQGKILIESELGVGTTATVVLPKGTGEPEVEKDFSKIFYDFSAGS